MKSSFIKFLWFLFRNGALIKFKRNLHAPLRAVNNFGSTDYYVIGSFFWGNAPEGREYWNNIHDKWVKYEK